MFLTNLAGSALLSLMMGRPLPMATTSQNALYICIAYIYFSSSNSNRRQHKAMPSQPVSHAIYQEQLCFFVCKQCNPLQIVNTIVRTGHGLNDATRRNKYIYIFSHFIEHKKDSRFCVTGLRRNAKCAAHNVFLVLVIKGMHFVGECVFSIIII